MNDIQMRLFSLIFMHKHFVHSLSPEWFRMGRFLHTHTHVLKIIIARGLSHFYALRKRKKKRFFSHFTWYTTLYTDSADSIDLCVCFFAAFTVLIFYTHCVGSKEIESKREKKNDQQIERTMHGRWAINKNISTCCTECISASISWIKNKWTFCVVLFTCVKWWTSSSPSSFLQHN